jgi:DNA mismatch endonuclease (patch repair protein)
MLDRVSREKRSRIMSAIRSENTKPELTLRKALWSGGLRFRIHYGEEKIDIAFPSQKLAVFVDGCFWHKCPLHSHLPKSRKDYWTPKLAKNVARDKQKDKRLKAMGWVVLHFWEHDIPEIDAIVAKITAKLPAKKTKSLT